MPEGQQTPLIQGVPRSQQPVPQGAWPDGQQPPAGLTAPRAQQVVVMGSHSWLAGQHVGPHAIWLELQHVFGVASELQNAPLVQQLSPQIAPAQHCPLLQATPGAQTCSPHCDDPAWTHLFPRHIWPAVQHTVPHCKEGSQHPPLTQTWPGLQHEKPQMEPGVQQPPPGSTPPDRQHWPVMGSHTFPAPQQIWFEEEPHTLALGQHWPPTHDAPAGQHILPQTWLSAQQAPERHVCPAGQHTLPHCCATLQHLPRKHV